MEENLSFELEGFQFHKNGIEYYVDIEGDADWCIDNDSFDYAGTHCTGGKGGTHTLPDYATLQDFKIHKMTLFFELKDEYTNHWFEAEKSFDHSHKEHQGFIKFFEEQHRDDLFDAIQEQEDNEGNVIEWLQEV